MGVIELRREILSRLKDIWDEEDFHLGVLMCLHTEAQAKKMLDFLDEGNTYPSDITTAALFIERGLD